ncbi:nucleoporin autopeptidase-domain-containing protein [Mycena floridula]|nr:nucleoporin autopeptidase-domain-containing protein [Mycena floridula]
MFQSSWGAAQQPQQSTFGQSTFGQPAATTSAFGAQPAHNPMFGNLTPAQPANNGGAFGNNNNNASLIKPAVGFGAGTGSAFGGGGTSAFGTNTGTSPFGGGATTNAFGGASSSTNAFGSGGGTFGGTNASNSTPAFGQTSTFGGNAFNKPTTGFGAAAQQDGPVAPVTTGSSNPIYTIFNEKDTTTNATIQYQSISAMPAYRGTSFEEIRVQDYAQNRKTSTSFSQPSGFGAQPNPAFGQTAAPAFGAAPAAPAANPFGGGGGGGGGGFGQSTQPSAFGQAAQPAQNPFGAPAFGQQPAQPQQNTLGGFGQPAQPHTNNTFGGNAFGQKPNAFGGLSNTTNAFGQAQQPAAQPQTNAFGQPAATNGFGNTAFGAANNNAAKPSIFGTPAAQPNAFGAASAAPAAPLFGANPTTNLFGGSNLFGQNSQPNNNAFGLNKPAVTTSPFGALQPQQPANATQPTTNLFGNSTGGFGQGNTNMFGQPKAPALGQSNSTGGLGFSGNGLNFSTTAPNGGAQGTLTASISQPISTNLPIFSMLPPGPRAVDLEQSIKRKSGFFVDVPTRSPVPRVQLSYSPASSKLRGFGSSTSSSPSSSMFTSSFSNSVTLARNDSAPDVFLLGSSSSLGSGQRKSVKKLVLDKKVAASELFTKSGSSPLKGGKITFSPALSIAARESASAPPAIREKESPVPAPKPRSQRSPNRFAAPSTNAAGDGDSASDKLEEGDYWVSPPLSVLKTLGYEEISSFKGLVVGRVGYGEIHFLEPVDLTGLSKLSALCGEVIRFDDKECSVYPDSDDIDKPAPGSGLNVPAKISLLRCWAVDKATRDPLKDETNPVVVRHLKKLKSIKDTRFESFDMADGKWTFSVDHF